MHPRRNVLNALDLALNGVDIAEGERGRRAESGSRIAEPLRRRRMIVLLHRVVFRVGGGQEHVRRTHKEIREIREVFKGHHSFSVISLISL